MKKILTILMIFTLFLFTGCATLSSVKGRENFAEEHNMTIVMNTEQVFYAVGEDQSYILYCKHIPDFESEVITLLCYYVDGEFYSKIETKVTEGDTIYVTLHDKKNYILGSQSSNIKLSVYGYRYFTAMLKYYRAKLLVDFSRDLGIFIPDDKKKEYQLDDIDRLFKEFLYVDKL